MQRFRVMIILAFLLALWPFICCYGQSYPGRILALVDINHDELTDLIIQTNKTTVICYVASRTRILGEDVFSPDPGHSINIGDGAGDIVNAALSDFDGDSYVDMVVTYAKGSDSTSKGPFRFKIFWGNDSFKSSDPVGFSQVQPTIVDFDLDGVSDLFVVSKTGNRSCLLGRKERKLANNSVSCFTAKGHTISSTAATAWVDLTGDMSPDLLIRSHKDNKLTFEVHTYKSGSWHLNQTLMPSPFGSSHNLLNADVSEDKLLIGQSVFADFDLDGRIDHIIPVCQSGSDCGSTASFYVWTQRTNDWYASALNLTASDKMGGDQWSFVDRAAGIDGITFRAGDYTRDGYVDLIGILQDHSSDKNRKGFLIQNRPCVKKTFGTQKCDSEKLHFDVAWDPLGGFRHVTATTFMDLSEDGSLDVIIESLDSSQKPHVHLIGATADKGDTCFLKAQVFTGSCATKKCPSGSVGSGVALPGACLYYESANPDGSKRHSQDCQLIQSTHRSLQLPYALFGLGQSPNFVDFLKVGVPYMELEVREFPQIVPNSRLYVIPYPMNQTSQWISRLYVTPSRLILLSFATLSCVCGVILFIIVVLQIQEKRADRKERLQEAHKFHFDAM